MNSRIEMRYKGKNIHGRLFWQVCGMDWQEVLIELHEGTIVGGSHLFVSRQPRLLE